MEFLKMLRLSKGTKKTALATALSTGLIASAAVLLAPLVSHAQQWRDDRDFRGDADARGYRGDVDSRAYRGYMDDRDYRGDWNDRVGVGFGVYGYPGSYPYYSGYYDPYAYNYGYDAGSYCSSYDSYYGYCSY